jgi:hypothetical protein
MAKVASVSNRYEQVPRRAKGGLANADVKRIYANVSP